ncbi:MAG: hypothetical protein AAFR20_07095 [Pseudomonadota bacterium]
MFSAAFLGLAAMTLIVGVLFSPPKKALARGPVQPSAHIEMAATPGKPDTAQITITLCAPVTALDFGLLLTGPDGATGLRQRQWVLAGDDHRFVRRASRLYAVRKDGKPFTRLRFEAPAIPLFITGDYQPAFAMTAQDGSPVLGLYTGHFWPYDAPGRRMPVSFSLSQDESTQTQTLAPIWPVNNHEALSDHPAFVFFGAGGAHRLPRHDVLVHAALADWVKAEAEPLIDEALTVLADGFGVPLGERPLIVLAKAGSPGDRAQPSAPHAVGGLFRFAGDALPRQVLTVIDGSPWDTPSATGRSILRRALVHELVHLWQARIRPQSPDVPAWIHEGAAEAITAEVLVRMGLWEPSAAEAFHRKAAADCDEGARYKRVDTLTKAAAFRTVYACGHMLARLAAMPRQGTPSSTTPVMDFWRAFLDESKGPDARYSLESWLAFTAARSGNQPRATAIRQFLTRKWPLPAARLEQIGEIEPGGSYAAGPASE